ncbi:MAG: acyl--CoA ligase [Acidobacteria bacterium]|nr:acyl--CoA ligase [Acidobacteriota bacterium]
MKVETSGHQMAKDPITEAFSRLLARNPLAVLVASPAMRATVADVDAMARTVEQRIGKAGLGDAAPIALRAPNGPGFLAVLLACRRAGAAALLLDERTTDHEADRITRRLGAAGLVSCSVAWPGDEGGISVRATGHCMVADLPDRVAVIKMTSGSTGEPQGIAIAGESLLADDEALTATMGITPSDRLLATVPFSHSYGLSSLVMPALVRGCTLIVPAGRGPFDPLTAAGVLDATVFTTVPAYLSALLRVSDRIEFPSSLRLVVSAGAPLIPETAVRFRERHGRFAHVFYGASECGGITYDAEGSAAERGTLGEPIRGVRIRLETMDGKQGNVGRIVVSSPAVAESYYPDSDDDLRDGYFVSSDLGSWTGSELKLVGRVDEVINIRGRKINPREIERVIEKLEHVDEVKVLGVLMPESGDTVLRAVIACPSGALDWDRVRSWCRGRLSDFKIPRSVVLVDRLPRDDRGKIVRAELVRGAGVDDRSGHERN